MSATRDKNQKIAFVYSNMYALYKKGKDAATASTPFAINRTAPVEPAAPATGASRSVSAAPVTVKGKLAPTVSDIDAELSRDREPRQHVLKVANLVESAPASVKINSYSPPEFIGKRIVQKPEYLAKQNPAIESLKTNLKTLNDLHSRLRFMLQELEDLIKE
jgi:hypothetical protein